MNIREYFKSWFIKKNSKESSNDINSKKRDGNSITFCIDGFGKSWVYVEIANTDTYSSNEFAKLLFDLNEGRYENSILNLMVSLSKEHPNLATTIENILINWEGLLIDQSTENKESFDSKTQPKNRPFIRPRNVFLGHSK